MLTPATLRKIRRIELKTRRLVASSLAGAYHAVFKGRGMAFDSVRPYEPGDDVRDIDWNVTARTGEPYSKKFIEERELTVILMVDASASVMFGTVSQQKRDLAVELAAVLALAAVSNNDRVGLLMFSDRIELYLPPRKGRNHILRLIRDLLAAKPIQKGTNLALALQTVNRLLKRRAIVFLISDFLVSGDDFLPELMLTSQRHDVIAVTLRDPLEVDWPEVGLVALQDAETGTLIHIDTADPAWRRQFLARQQRFQQTQGSRFTRAGVDHIRIPASGDYVQALAAFFQRRSGRLHR